MAKTTGAGGWRQKSTGFLAAVAAAVLVVVLVGGVALGYAIEKSRVKTSAKSAKTTPNKPAKKVAVPVVSTKGTVDTTAATGITIAPAKGPKQKVAITKATQVVKLTAGSLTDIAAKSRVLFVGLKGSYTAASAVIVLPAKAKLGDVVFAADANTMSLGTAKKSAKIDIKGASVEKSTAATRADIAKGAKVVVASVRTKTGALIAVEVIILASNSPFA